MTAAQPLNLVCACYHRWYISSMMPYVLECWMRKNWKNKPHKFRNYQTNLTTNATKQHHNIQSAKAQACIHAPCDLSLSTVTIASFLLPCGYLMLSFSSLLSRFYS